MKKSLIFLIVLLMGIGILGGVTNKTKVDGMIVPPYERIIHETGQKAVIFYEKGRETLIISISFRGNSKDFGWIVPVPQKPEISKGSDEIFTSLDKIIQKNKKVVYPPYDILPALQKTEERVEPVTIIETKKIDYYDITVLSATDAQALTKWFETNGYPYPKESAYILNDYINNQWFFIAIKISPEAEGAEEVVKNLKEGHVTPLKIEFSSGAIIYPLRISAIQFDLEPVKLSDNLFLDSERISHLKKIGYEDLTDKEKGPKIFNQIILDLINKKSYTESLASKYPLIISESQYISPGPCTTVKDCQRKVETWFNDYFSREGLYYYPYKTEYIPIYLYVIADGKKEIPGFFIDYANWISAKDVRKLAYDINGRPLINPQGKKYYLTHLYRTMPIQEINYDLIIRDAENNKRINAPNPWMNFVLGILIVLGCIFFWVFSPIGLIFIGATLLKCLLKRDDVRIFSRILQGFSFIITLILFIFVLVLSLKYYPNPTIFLWVVGLACGLGIVLLGQTIISKKI